ncbi:hypothetical protein [Paracoccus sp. IB05]|uniref:hypothetical protein n=1 Tax=Paracoccus sp. IB05 TaxID=2779367 RepID=UPI0018E7230B|nr:hypothetical protein [Paracoccus sp. IB05]MBJ2151917.1 hypothetical protein [Paracoccus sp. IB05]
MILKQRLLFGMIWAMTALALQLCPAYGDYGAEISGADGSATALAGVMIEYLTVMLTAGGAGMLMAPCWCRGKGARFFAGCLTPVLISLMFSAFLFVSEWPSNPVSTFLMLAYASAFAPILILVEAAVDPLFTVIWLAGILISWGYGRKLQREQEAASG